MIQFNLLPDVKQEFIKARRSKRMVLLISTGITAASLLIFASLFTVVNVLQTKHINDLNGDIKKYTATLKAVPDLDKVLTIQNQLSALTSLHQQKPQTSRLFDYLTQITPAQATISSLKYDGDAKTLTISGDADSISTVNKYVDTLKFTEYTVSGGNQAKAFSNVVLSSFGSGDKGATYQIGLSFDPVIFDNTKQVSLVVPKIISTRSETEKPSDLFVQSSPPKGQ